MVRDDLVNYVKSSLSGGASKDQVAEALRTAGYMDGDIQEAIAKAQGMNATSVTMPSNLTSSSQGGVKTNGLAIASLILGIVGLIFVPLIASIAAIITGFVALSKIKKNDNETGRGLAITGIILGFFGLVIMLLLITLGIIAYFGVLSPDKFLPERCSGPSGLDRASIQKNGDVQIVLKNNLGYEIEFEQGIATTEDCSAAMISSVNDFYEFPMSIENGEKAVLKINCGNLDSGSFKTDITVTYRNKETGLTHSGIIQITGTVP